jgi:multidrug resistance protein
MKVSDRAAIQQVSILMATVFIDMVGFLVVLPLLPFYAERMGGTPALVGALVSVFALAQLVTSPFWGRFSDRLGRRPIILGGLVVSALAYVLFGLAESVEVLFLSRIVQGAGGGTTGVVQAYVADSFAPADRAKALGWVTSATSAGVMIGPLVGSFATYLGPQGPGFLAAGLCVLNFLFAWRWLPEPRRHAASSTADEPRSLGRAAWEVLRHPGAPVSSLVWIYAFGMMAFMAMNGILALYLDRAFGITEKTIGWFYTYVGGVSLVMRALLLGRAVRRFGEVGVTRLGALSLAAGLATIPLAPSLPLLAVAALFVPVGTALLFPAITALISHRSPRSETGQTLGVQQGFGGVSRMLGPLWAGAVFEIGIRYPFWLAAALMLGVSVLTRRLREGGGEEAAPAAATGEGAEAG